MLVLVTRARDEAVRTAKKLAQRGHRPILSSVLEIQATGAPWPPGVVDALIATSAHAFEFLALESEWPQPEARRLLPLFLVGERTAAAARLCGFDGPTFLAPDAKDLATLIAERAVRPRRFIYLAGRDRKADLEARLHATDVAVETIEVYEARGARGLNPEAIEHFRAGTLDAALHYSKRSAEIFLKLAKAAHVTIEPLLHVAISEDAAQPLRHAGLPHIAVAAEPNEQAVLALLGLLANALSSFDQARP
jgi:uroporphyrinogen-III synthase